MKINKNNQKGVSLLLVLLIMAALLSIAFGISRLAFGEMKLSQDAPLTTIAYYAAEAGIECQMYNDRLLGETLCGGGTYVYLDAGQKIAYIIQVSGSYKDSNPPRTIKSTGSYKDVKRGVELTY